MKQYLDLQGTEILVGKILERVDKQLLIDYVSQQVDIIEEDANGHDYIEINGVKWATMNVGASNPEDTGLYFQWGDTLGYSAELIENLEKAFLASDYKFNPNGDNLTFTKYNSTDGKVILDLEDDPVHAAWGGTWRLPTVEEFKSLVQYAPGSCTAKNQKGVIKFTDFSSDPTKQLYFPYCGYATNGNVIKLLEKNYVYSGGGPSFLVSSFYSLYLSNSLNKYNVDEACGLSFYEKEHYPEISYLEMYKRFYGMPVRGVLGSAKSPKYATKVELPSSITTEEIEELFNDGDIHDGHSAGDDTRAAGLYLRTPIDYDTPLLIVNEAGSLVILDEDEDTYIITKSGDNYTIDMPQTYPDEQSDWGTVSIDTVNEGGVRTFMYGGVEYIYNHTNRSLTPGASTW